MPIPSDPRIPNQWHLTAARIYTTAPGNPSVWDDYTGEGIHVGVYDNGVQATHPDLDANYDASREYTGPGAQANANGVQHHGTTVAGIIAAEANGTDTVGVAYDATVTGVRIYGPGVTASDAFYRGVFEHQAVFDVVNHSWGASAHGWGPTGTWYQQVEAGMAYAAAEGRFGLGTNVVVTSGNDRDGQQEDLNNGPPAGNGRDSDANIQAAHTNSRYAITVASAGQNNFVSDYSTPGACILVTAPSQGTWDGANGGIVATDKTDDATAGFQQGADGWAVGSVATNLQGTSFAAPTVTGVVALMLEANRLLGWRDVKEILAASAFHIGSAVGGGTANAERNPWYTNGARDWNGGGHNFSEDYGFGGIDARAAVRLAESWTEIKTSANEDGRAAATAYSPGLAITDNSTTNITFDISSGVDIETVVVRLGLRHTFSGDLRITLTSPSGTVSSLLNRVGGDYDVNGLVLTSNSFLGEESAGTWTLTIRDLAGGDVGTLTSTSLDIFGSTSSADDTFIYTDDYAWIAGSNIYRTYLDGQGGIDTLNAAGISGNCTIDLTGTANGGAISTLGGTALRILGGIENVVTGDGGDVINGNAADNWLRSMRGDDQINGNGGKDKLEGGAGNDRLYGGADNDIIIGGFGNDVMVGDAGDDLLIVSRFSNQDTVVGGSGKDTLSFELDDIDFLGMTIDLTQSSVSFQFPGLPTTKISYAEIENLTGAASFDTLRGNDMANVLIGLGGNDTLEGRGGADIINGGFTNYLDSRGNDGNDKINAGAGNDRVIASLGVDTIDGGADFDTLEFAWVTNPVTASMVTGKATFFAGGGWNEPYSGDLGGWGSKNTTNFSNFEVLVGGSGNDNFTGDDVNNRLYGGAGDDILNGRKGADLLYGDIGNDTYYVDNTGDRTNDVAGAAGGKDTVRSSITWRLSPNIEDLTLTGSASIGGTGNELDNYLVGNSGSNSLSGAGGNDLIRGAGGGDQMKGGAGADRFLFMEVGDSPFESNRDKILDFNHAERDRIDISRVYGPALQFIGTAAFTGEGQVRIASSGYIAVNLDADATPEMIIYVNNATSLVAGDFIL